MELYRGLRARLLFWGGLLVVVTIASGFVSALRFARVSRAMGDAVAGDKQTGDLVQTASSALEDEDDAVLLILNGDAAEGAIERLAEARRFGDAMIDLSAASRGTPENAAIGEVARAAAAYRKRCDEVIALTDPIAARTAYQREVAPLLRQTIGLCTLVREHRYRATQAVVTAARDDANEATKLVALSSVLAVTLLGLIGFRVAKTVVNPLRELTASVDAIGAADFSRRVDETVDDEIGRLAAGVNRMTESLAAFNASRLGEVLAAKETLEATLEALPEAVLVVSSNGDITRSNARARAIFGSITTIDAIALPPGSKAAIGAVAAGAPQASASRADLGRAMTVTVDGHDRLLLPRIVATSAASGQAVVVLDDVTDFARLDEARTEFIAAASHELRTPLTTLRMTLALLEEADSSADAHRKETIATARLGCEQLAATVDAFLDVTRAEAGALVLARGRVDVRALVDRVTRPLRSRFTEQNASLDVTPTETDIVVLGDAARLSAALSNLLTNALKYGPSGGHVRVASSLEGGHAVLTVDDDGPGVPDDLRERVFEKYFRIEQTRPHHGEHARGAGIGLYLCRQIVEAHGGTVRCEPSPRGGARFTIRVPITSG